MRIRTYGFLSVAALTALTASLASCGGSSSGLACSSTSTTAVYEDTLSTTRGQCASADKVVMVSLESDTETSVATEDTGGVGYDVIPYKVETAATYSFEVPDDGGSAMEVILKDKEGVEILRTKTGEGAVSADLQADNYYVEIHNDGTESVSAYLIPQEGGASTTPAGLTGAKWKLSFQTNCRGCDLRGVRANHVALWDIDWTDANLTGADLYHCSFRGVLDKETKRRLPAVMNGAILVDAKMGRATAEGAEMVGADLSGADLTDATLTHAKLTDAKLVGATLSGADFNYATMIRADLTKVTGVKTKFGNANNDMTDAILVKANLESPKMAKIMVRVDMTDAIMTKATMVGSDVTDAKFIRTDLREAQLYEATITGADFSGAKLHQVWWANGGGCENAEPVGVCIDLQGEVLYP